MDPPFRAAGAVKHHNGTSVVDVAQVPRPAIAAPATGAKARGSRAHHRPWRGRRETSRSTWRAGDTPGNATSVHSRALCKVEPAASPPPGARSRTTRWPPAPHSELDRPGTFRDKRLATLVQQSPALQRAASSPDGGAPRALAPAIGAIVEVLRAIERYRRGLCACICARRPVKRALWRGSGRRLTLPAGSLISWAGVRSAAARTTLWPATLPPRPRPAAATGSLRHLLNGDLDSTCVRTRAPLASGCSGRDEPGAIAGDSPWLKLRFAPDSQASSGAQAGRHADLFRPGFPCGSLGVTGAPRSAGRWPAEALAAGSGPRRRRPPAHCSTAHA